MDTTARRQGVEAEAAPEEPGNSMGASRLHGHIAHSGAPHSFLVRDPRLRPRSIDSLVELSVPATKEEWEVRKALVRRVVQGVIGPSPRPADEPVSYRELEVQKFEGYRLVSIEIHVSRSLQVYGSLYVPEAAELCPAVLHPHGHWPNGRYEATDSVSVPAACANLALRGYVALSYDMVGYGDTKGVGHGAFSSDWRHRQAGLSLFGLQAHVGLACLDILANLPYVDPSRIGCVGASGGGSQVLALSVLDPRIAAAAPVSMVSAECQGWCLCENPPALRTAIHNLDLAAAIAPRPLLLVSATGDWTAQTPHREYPQIQAVYDLYGARDSVRHEQVDAGHNYNMENRQHVYRWFDGVLSIEGSPEDYLEIPIPLPRASAVPVKANSDSSEQLLAEEWVDRIDSHTSQLLRGDKDKLLAAVRRRFDLDIEMGAPRLLATKSVADDSTRVGLMTYDGGMVPYTWHRGDAPGHTVVVVSDQCPRPAFWRELLERARAEAQDVFLVHPFLTSVWNTPLGRLGRANQGLFPLTYNRHDSVEQVRDVAAFLVWLERNVTELDSVSIVGVGDLGPVSLLSAAMTRGVAKASVDIPHAYDLGRFPYTSAIDCPGLRAVGGLSSSIALLGPEKVRVFGLQGEAHSGPGWSEWRHTVTFNESSIELSDVSEVL